jgi:hypothetical protein
MTHYTHIQSIMPNAYRYEGANGGTVQVAGTDALQYVLTQVVSFPSADNTAACGVDQVSIYFTVITSIDTAATISWAQLTNGEYAPGGKHELCNSCRISRYLLNCKQSLWYKRSPTTQLTLYRQINY